MMWWLLPHGGVHGLAFARLCYGSFSLLLYLPLIRSLVSGRSSAAADGTFRELEEVSQL